MCMTIYLQEKGYEVIFFSTNKFSKETVEIKKIFKY